MGNEGVRTGWVLHEAQMEDERTCLPGVTFVGSTHSHGQGTAGLILPMEVWTAHSQRPCLFKDSNYIFYCLENTKIPQTTQDHKAQRSDCRQPLIYCLLEMNCKSLSALFPNSPLGSNKVKANFMSHKLSLIFGIPETVHV